MIKILHTADLHISETNSKVLVDIIDIAKDREVDALIIAGDLFDSAFPSTSDKSYINALFEKIPDIQIFMVAGNHDPLPTYKDLEFPPNVHFFGNEIERVGIREDVDIYGVSFDEAYVTSSLIEDFRVEDPEKVNILVVHGDVGQVTKYNPISMRQIEEIGVDYLALGHVHAYSGVKKAGLTTYAYPGVPQGRGFDELGEKGVLVGKVRKGHAELNFVKTSVMEYYEVKVDISHCTDYSEICEAIKGLASNPSHGYKVTLIGSFAGGFEINPDFICNILNYENIKITDATRAEVDLVALSAEFTLRGLFVKKALEREVSEAAISYGLSVLDGKKVELW